MASEDDSEPKGRTSSGGGVQDEAKLATETLRAVLTLSRRLRAERPRDRSGTGLSALGMLATLRRLGPMPAARLADEERLAPQSLTRILSRLERDGLITRARGTRDRRELLISVTPKGLAHLRRDLVRRRSWLSAAIAAHLDAGDRAALAAATPVMMKLAALAAGENSADHRDDGDDDA